MGKVKLGLFLTGLIQVTLVAMNTVYISKGMIIPMLITGFGISLVWTLNVKKISIGSWSDRFTYATGAMIGTGAGYYIAHYLNKIL